MQDFLIYKKRLEDHGFMIIDNIYSTEEIEQFITTINKADSSKNTFRKSKDLFAIRQFLKEIPGITNLILNDRFKKVTTQLFGNDYFVVKSIYFDKPEESNWFVSYHQDLTISVDKKVDLENYSKWTIKQDQFSVQPPLNILQNIFTVRIHLDDTNEYNGALKVIPASHIKGIYRPENIDWTVEKEEICSIPKGGIMIMKPLLLHSSSRTINNNKRRVIHIEFSNIELPAGIKWVEKIS